MIKKNQLNAICIAGIAWGIFHHSSASAQTTGETEPVIVTATRTAQIADQTLTPTIVITQQDIQLSQSRDVAELLRFHAGIELSRNGGPGQQTSLFVRGTESDHVIIMIDGVKMNAGTVALAAIQNIDPALIEQIEIVKGPRSSLYGSEGIGGIVNIITRKSTQTRDIIQADVGVGSDNTQQIHGGYHTLLNKTRIGIDAKRFTTDGFPTLEDSSIDRGFKNNTLNAYVNSEFGSTKVDLSYWTARGTTEYIGLDPVSFTDIPVDQDFENNVAALSVNSAINANASVKFKLSQMIDDITQNQSDDRAKTTRQTIDVQSDIEINDSNLLSAGLYYADEEVDAVIFSEPLQEEGKNNTVKAIFVQDDFQLASNHLVAALRYTDDNNFGNETTYNLDYGYAVSAQLRMLAGVGTGFRAPTPVDRFSGFGGNAELKAETSQNIELGSRYKLDQHHTFSVSLFQNDIDNLINWNSATSTLENIGQTRIRGLELGYRLRQQNWTSRINVIFQDPRDRTTGDILLRRAKRSLTASVQYQLQRHSIGADLLASSKRQDFGATLAAYAIVNFNYLYRVNDSWQVTTHIENLFDKQYEIASGYNSQRRFLMLGFKYSY